MPNLPEVPALEGWVESSTGPYWTARLDTTARDMIGALATLPPDTIVKVDYGGDDEAAAHVMTYFPGKNSVYL